MSDAEHGAYVREKARDLSAAIQAAQQAGLEVIIAVPDWTLPIGTLESYRLIKLKRPF